MNFVTVWIVHETVDEYGRTGSRVGVYRSPLVAEEAAKGKGWWGGKGRVSMRRAINTEEGVYILEDPGQPVKFSDEAMEIDLRTQALAKLTPAERKALGLE